MNTLFLSISTGETVIIILLVLVIGLFTPYFIKMIKNQKEEIKDIEEKAAARKEARSQRRRK